MTRWLEPENPLPGHLGRGRSLLVSWLSMKTWVKVWLFFLNFVFLGALFFWPRREVAWILAGYLGSAPFLFGLMIYQRGLTRLLGIAHLIPWVPLTGYLLIRLSSDRLGPRITYSEDAAYFTYLVTLLGAIVLCLAFDAVDVYRWFNGERYVLGTRRAADLNASRRAVDPT